MPSELFRGALQHLPLSIAVALVRGFDKLQLLTVNSVWPHRLAT
jgi:hypothetical protein